MIRERVAEITRAATQQSLLSISCLTHAKDELSEFWESAPCNNLRWQTSETQVSIARDHQRLNME
jgi:hypothetical protein